MCRQQIWMVHHSNDGRFCDRVHEENDVDSAANLPNEYLWLPKGKLQILQISVFGVKPNETMAYFVDIFLAHSYINVEDFVFANVHWLNLLRLEIIHNLLGTHLVSQHAAYAFRLTFRSMQFQLQFEASLLPIDFRKTALIVLVHLLHI